METKLKELEVEHLSCKEESELAINNVNCVRANFEEKLKEQDDLLKVLNLENSLLKQKNEDVNDEILMKKQTN